MLNEMKSSSAGVENNPSKTPEPNQDLNQSPSPGVPQIGQNSKLKWVLIILGILELPLPTIYLLVLLELIHLNKSISESSTLSYFGIAFFLILVLLAFSQIALGLLSTRLNFKKKKAEILIILGILLSVLSIPIIYISVINPIYSMTSKIIEDYNPSLSPTPSPNPTAKWDISASKTDPNKTDYTNTKYKFRFEMPSSWEYNIDKDESVEESITFYNPEFASIYGGQNSKSLIIVRVDKTELEDVDTFSERVWDETSDIPEPTYTITDLSGVKAIKYNISQQGERYDYILHAIHNGYLLTITNGLYIDENVDSAYEEMLQTFKFTDSESETVDKNGLRTYRNEEIGFQFKYPDKYQNVKVNKQAGEFNNGINDFGIWINFDPLCFSECTKEDTPFSVSMSSDGLIEMFTASKDWTGTPGTSRPLPIISDYIINNDGTVTLTDYRGEYKYVPFEGKNITGVILKKLDSFHNLEETRVIFKLNNDNYTAFNFMSHDEPGESSNSELLQSIAKTFEIIN